MHMHTHAHLRWTKLHHPVEDAMARYPPQTLTCGGKLSRLEEDRKVVELMSI